MLPPPSAPQEQSGTSSPDDTAPSVPQSKVVLAEIGAVGHDIVQGWLLLLLATQPCHGYDLVEALRAQGMTIGDPSYIYRLLRKLEQGGLLSSEWHLSGRGATARRVYCISDAGQRALDKYADAIGTLGRQLRTYNNHYQNIRQRYSYSQGS
jgi:DNA-binding PadR family transcriptional regulator